MNNKLRYSILITDLLWVTAAFVLTQIFRSPLLGAPENAVTVATIGVAIVSWTVVYATKSLDGFTQGSSIDLFIWFDCATRHLDTCFG